MPETPEVAKSSATKKPQTRVKAPRVRSKKNELAGVVVLAAGTALFLGIGSYIFLKESSKGHSRVVMAATPAPSQKKEETPPAEEKEVVAADVSPKVPEHTQTQAEEAASACIGCSSGPQFIMPPLPDKSALFVPKHEELKGQWIAELPDGVARAVFSGLTFQVVYYGRSDSDFRKYVVGYYSYDSDSGVISLKPAYKLGPPENDPKIVYQVLTQRFFDVIVRRNEDGSSIYWQSPPETLASMQVFPLLLYTGLQQNPYLKWDRVR